MSLRSGLQVTQGFDIQAIYTRNVSDTDFRSSKTRSTSTTWPDIQINWDGLEKFALFRPYFASARANINFKIFTQETGRKEQDPDNSRRSLIADARNRVRLEERDQFQPQRQLYQEHERHPRIKIGEHEPFRVARFPQALSGRGGLPDTAPVSKQARGMVEPTRYEPRPGLHSYGRKALHGRPGVFRAHTPHDFASHITLALV